MKLQNFLLKRHIGVSDMARQLNIPQSTCSMWVNEQRIPSLDNMQKIFAYTDGMVTPNDFYNITDSEQIQSNCD